MHPAICFWCNAEATVVVQDDCAALRSSCDTHKGKKRTVISIVALNVALLDKVSEGPRFIAPPVHERIATAIERIADTLDAVLRDGFVDIRDGGKVDPFR